LEQRNVELDRLLAAANAAAESQGQLVKEVLARINNGAPAAKARSKASTAG
jgi:hypothetical protein